MPDDGRISSSVKAVSVGPPFSLVRSGAVLRFWWCYLQHPDCRLQLPFGCFYPSISAEAGVPAFFLSVIGWLPAFHRPGMPVSQRALLPCSCPSLWSVAVGGCGARFVVEVGGPLRKALSARASWLGLSQSSCSFSLTHFLSLVSLLVSGRSFLLLP